VHAALPLSVCQTAVMVAGAPWSDRPRDGYEGEGRHVSDWTGEKAGSESPWVSLDPRPSVLLAMLVSAAYGLYLLNDARTHWIWGGVLLLVGVTGLVVRFTGVKVDRDGLRRWRWWLKREYSAAALTVHETRGRVVIRHQQKGRVLTLPKKPSTLRRLFRVEPSSVEDPVATIQAILGPGSRADKVS
jgi:hypothetical protein